MSLYPYFHQRPAAYGDLFRDLGRFERQMNLFDRPCAGLQGLSNLSNEITNDENKFAIDLNVHQFKPEELKIDLDGRRLTIEGVQEVKNDEGFSKRTFSRVILLPEDVDLSAVSSNLTAEGHLSIEAPKKEVVKGRNIPIQQNATPAVTEKPHAK